MRWTSDSLSLAQRILISVHKRPVVRMFCAVYTITIQTTEFDNLQFGTLSMTRQSRTADFVPGEQRIVRLSGRQHREGQSWSAKAPPLSALPLADWHPSAINLTVHHTPYYMKLECGPMPNAMTAQRHIGGAVSESSVIPFITPVPRRKVWLTPTGRVPCSNAANIGERKTWPLGRNVKFAPGKIPSGGKSPREMYNIMCKPRRRPNIVQSLVGLRWTTSLQ